MGATRQSGTEQAARAGDDDDVGEHDGDAGMALSGPRRTSWQRRRRDDADQGALFLRRYYRHVAAEDILERTPEELLAAVVAHRELAAYRPPGLGSFWSQSMNRST